MKIKSGKYVLNTEDCTKLKEHTRITRDELTPRVYFLKTEVLCKMKHSRPVRYFNLVQVEKYIDNTMVKTYTWIQSVDAIELTEFLNIHYKPPKPPKPQKVKEVKTKEEKPKTPPLTQKERNRLYYLKHKEQIKEKARQNYYDNKEDKNNYSKIYYQEHKDTWKEKYLKK